MLKQIYFLKMSKKLYKKVNEIIKLYMAQL